jgi:hypothetical protein
LDAADDAAQETEDAAEEAAQEVEDAAERRRVRKHKRFVITINFTFVQ